MANLTKQRSWVLQLNDECNPSWGELETFPPGTETGQTLVWNNEKGEWEVGTVAQATETLAGIARIATTAEAAAGTDDQTIITPAKLASALSAFRLPALLDSPGYVTIPTNDPDKPLIIQWGSVGFPNSTAATVTFPIPFPNRVFGGFANHSSSEAGGGVNSLAINFGNPTGTGTTLFSSAAYGGGANYIVFGC